MRITRTMFALAPAAVAFTVAGCGGGSGTSSAVKASPTAGNSQAASAPGVTVGLGKTKFGQVLVDSKGRSLYLFEKDTGTASTCFGDCASAWPPLTVSGTPTSGAGIVGAKLGTTKRTDGQTEVTYNGHPLYYYIADTAPGQTSGQGLNQFGAGWDLVAPTGKKVESDN